MTGTEVFDLLKNLGFFSIGMFTIQLIISKSADRKFESYKTELDHRTREFQSTLDTKIELYKAELTLQHYKSTQTYELQLKAIIEMHKILVALNRDMKVMTAFFKPIISDMEKEEQERIDKAIGSYNAFIVFLDQHLIFLPQKTADAIEKVRNDFMSSILDYNFSRQFSGGDRKYSMDKYVEAGKRVEEKVQPAINQLIADFRGLIGVEK